MQEYSRNEVAKHNSPEDCWIIVNNEVYDVTKFANLHPGGASVLFDVAGQDATEVFEGLHKYEVLEKFGPRLVKGKVKGEEPVKIDGFAAFSKVPYAEQPFFQGFPSRYYTERHKHFRQVMRNFYAEHVKHIALDCEDRGEPISEELYKKMGDAGVLACLLGPGEHLKMAPNGLPGGIKPEEFDYTFEAISHEERARLFAPGFEDGFASGLNIALTVILHYGTEEMKRKYAPACIKGEKRICLAVTEAFAGSDVAGLKTHAKKDPTGEYYILNGTKKWITCGTFSDLFVVACRTGGEGKGGVSVLLVERSEGVETKLIKTSYGGGAGTSYITFDNVKVPAKNLIGEENKGFGIIMGNFNHERWTIVVLAICRARYVYEESFKWAMQRKVFGKPLASQPVIREKLADMIAQIESVQAWCNEITSQMNEMGSKGVAQHLGGQIALLKMQATGVGERVAAHGVQILGGRGMTRSGMGRVIETSQRCSKFPSVYGGASEIMADLGMKTAMKQFPKTARL